LRSRLAQLDEAIKPENIERSLAGVGSTRPEELRESRRKQLSIQRDGVCWPGCRRLKQVASGLESELANAETLAYQESARPKPTGDGSMMMVADGLSQRVMFAGGGLAVTRKVDGKEDYKDFRTDLSNGFSSGIQQRTAKCSSK